MAIADVITLDNETIDSTKPYLLFDPVYPYKNKTVENFKVVSLLEPIFVDGELVYNRPTLKEIRDYNQTQMKTMWDEIKRFERPHQYYVDLSKPLWDLRQNIIDEIKKQ